VIYRVVHRTEYRYESPVSSSFGELHLLPRDTPGQVCRSSRVHIDPGPDDYRERTDFYGNRVAAFAVLEPHTTLAVTAESVVAVSGPPGSSPQPVDEPWEAVRDRLVTDPSDETLEARDFLLESPKVMASPLVAAYAAESFTARRPLTEALTELIARIHDDFAYEPGATSVRTTLTELFERRKGVCQDFAHLAVGCLRSVGLAARYVSGYLETAPPPGRPRLVGADVSHAWASVFLPGPGGTASPGAAWIDLDPTNNRFVNDRYVTTAWGRDYGDVPPLKGVIYTDSTGDELHVSVDVAPLDPSSLNGPI
jgi:transglutaminase-like putative cysteine protease